MFRSTDRSGPTFSSKNPATGEIVWQGRSSTGAQVDEAVKEAKNAFEGWSNLPLASRARYLAAFSEELRKSQQNLAEIISQETGKPLWDSNSEVQAMINKVAISLEAHEKRCGEMIRDQANGRLITRHRPHGVVAVLGPYNFPAHLPNGHIVPALLAGNTVVFKASELTPLVAEKTMHLWEKADLPPGVLNLVQGGKETGQALIHHPYINGLFFTGSYETGRMLTQLFGTQPGKILALEMGGNNPLIVGEMSDLKAAAYAILQSAYLSSGQRCTCARRLIIQDTEILKPLTEMIKGLKIGSYTDSPEPFMGPVITEAHVQKLLAAQDNLQSKGGKILLDMRHIKSGTGLITPGLMDVTEIAGRSDEEIFGPFLQVIRVKDLKAAVEEANQTKFGLSAGLLSQNPEEYAYFFKRIKAGIVNWNTPLTGASSAAPFGGIKCSGNHRPSAYYAADYCSYPVASMETPELRLPDTFPPGIVDNGQEMDKKRTRDRQKMDK